MACPCESLHKVPAVPNPLTTWRLGRMQSVMIPLFLLAIAATFLSVALVVVGRLVGPRREGAVKRMPYESGMDPIHDARRRFDVRFYLVAIAFLVFDVELLFLYPWAASAYVDAGIPAELRDTVFVLMISFISTLVIAYIYAWRKGVFRWR